MVSFRLCCNEWTVNKPVQHLQTKMQYETIMVVKILDDTGIYNINWTHDILQAISLATQDTCCQVQVQGAVWHLTLTHYHALGLQHQIMV